MRINRFLKLFKKRTTIKILLILFVLFFIYKNNLFNYNFDFNFDIFEYIGHINTLNNFGDIDMIKEIKYGTTGEFPIYSKFPGYFMNVNNISLFTGLENNLSLIYYIIIFRIFFYLSLIIILKKILYNEIKDKYKFYLSLVILSIFYFPFIHLSTQLHNVLFFIIGAYIFLVYKKYFLGLILFYSLIIFHHQSLIVLSPIIFLIIINEIVYEKKSINKIFITGIFLLITLYFHFKYFILDDLDKMLEMGKALAGSDTFNDRVILRLFPFNIILSLLAFTYINKIKNNYRYLALLTFVYLFVFSFLPYFFPERVYFLLTLFNFPFLLLFIFHEKSKINYKIVVIIFLILNYSSVPYILKNNGFYRKENLSSTLNYYFIGYSSIKNGLLSEIHYLNEINSIKEKVGNNCVLGDIFVNFNFNNIGNINSCYYYERPLNPLKYKKFEIYKKYPLIENIYSNYNNIDSIYKILKENNIKYFVFNDYYVYYNKLSFNEGDMMKDKFIKLDKLNNKIKLIKKINFRDSNFYVYEIN